MKTWTVYLENLEGEVVDQTEVDAEGIEEAQGLGLTVFKESDTYKEGFTVRTECKDEEFGKIIFKEITKGHGAGSYNGQKFILLVPVDDEEGEPMIAVGEFTEAEQLFIYTQWEMKQ